ncbi:coatomer epsilon subunit-domain-containing protein [Lipomyces oligophaga]|uniref:coatomer epsilon subunit-domain-containing protein n=1 Tax=Lipomyces oligophaga TaxID=45792 RepID=UPI0034CD6649
MDAFSDSGELFAIHDLFYQGAYKEVLEQSTSGFSDSAVLQARVYKYRAQIALGHAASVVTALEDTENTPALAAVKALALYKVGDHEASLELVQELVETESEDPTVQVLCSIVLFLLDKVDDALLLLSQHEQNLAAVAMIVQIRLMQNKVDLAQKEVALAKKWGQDNLIVNLAEAWVDLNLGGEKYQDAFYIYEELASAPSTSNARTFAAQAVADILLGRLPEAEDAINQALERDSTSPDVLVNGIILYILLGRDYSTFSKQLEERHPDDAFLLDLNDKSTLFDACAAQYSSQIVE